jgi:hypothetical protein
MRSMFLFGFCLLAGCASDYSRHIVANSTYGGANRYEFALESPGGRVSFWRAPLIDFRGLTLRLQIGEVFSDSQWASSFKVQLESTYNEKHQSISFMVKPNTDEVYLFLGDDGQSMPFGERVVSRLGDVVICRVVVGEDGALALEVDGVGRVNISVSTRVNGVVLSASGVSSESSLEFVVTGN